MAWSNRGLPLHTGVLPPFLYGKGLHNHWVINEAMSSELRFIFDASWTITSFYVKDLDQWSEQLVEGSNLSIIKDRSWENVGNSHLGALYGSLYFHGFNYSNLGKHFKCAGQNLFINTSESIACSFEPQSSQRSWKRRILHPRREKKTMECIHAITSLGRNMSCSVKHQSDLSRPLYLPFSLENLLSVIADKNKTIILAVAGYSYKDMLMSWVCRLRSLLITNFVVCALDHDVYQFSILQVNLICCCLLLLTFTIFFSSLWICFTVQWMTCFNNLLLNVFYIFCRACLFLRILWLRVTSALTTVTLEQTAFRG